MSAAWMVSPSSCSMSTQVALSGTKAEALVLSQPGREVVVCGHVGDDGVDGGWVGVAGVDVGGGAVADALEDEGGTADEFDVAVGAGGLQAPAEFMEECPDLCGGEFSAAHAVARLRSRMKTFNAASSGGVSERVSSFMGARTVR